MLTWNVNTYLFSNMKLRRIISPLGRTTPSEKNWRENLANFFYLQRRKKAEEEGVVQENSYEERMRKLEEMEKERTKRKVQNSAKNPDIIEYEKNGRKVFLILEYHIYSSIFKTGRSH